MLRFVQSFPSLTYHQYARSESTSKASPKGKQATKLNWITFYIVLFSHSYLSRIINTLAQKVLPKPRLKKNKPQKLNWITFLHSLIQSFPSLTYHQYARSESTSKASPTEKQATKTKLDYYVPQFYKMIH